MTGNPADVTETVRRIVDILEEKNDIQKTKGGCELNGSFVLYPAVHGYTDFLGSLIRGKKISAIPGKFLSNVTKRTRINEILSGDADHAGLTLGASLHFPSGVHSTPEITLESFPAEDADGFDLSIHPLDVEHGKQPHTIVRMQMRHTAHSAAAFAADPDAALHRTFAAANFHRRHPAIFPLIADARFEPVDASSIELPDSLRKHRSDDAHVLVAIDDADRAA